MKQFIDKFVSVLVDGATFTQITTGRLKVYGLGYRVDSVYFRREDIVQISFIDCIAPNGQRIGNAPLNISITIKNYTTLSIETLSGIEAKLHKN